MGVFKKNRTQVQAIKMFTSQVRKFLLYGGSRSGKSFIILYAIIIRASKYAGSRHLVARFRFNHAKNSIWLDTLPKVLSVCFPDLVVKWNNQDYYITLPNGSEIWIGGLDDKERSEKILGMEFLSIFLNEASQLSYDAYTTVLTRLAQKVGDAKTMFFIDENPPSKKHWTYKLFIQKIEPEGRTPINDPDSYGHLKMNPDDNMENISEEYIGILENLPRRKRKRFLDGEFTDDSEGALWDDDMINRNRVKEAPPMKRIVIAVDPAVTSRDDSDETGIIVCGASFNNHLYVLEDATGTYTPTEWAEKVAFLFKKWQADRVVAEVNNGGDLVETVLRTVDKKIPYHGVHATRDKLTRAEPVSALWEQNIAHHVGSFEDLEFEMTTWEAKKGEKSPNRIDATVWGAHELSLVDQWDFIVS